MCVFQRCVRGIIFLLLGLSSLNGVAQTDSLPVNIYGIISASDSLLSTPYVHVINKRTGGGNISDAEGFFRTRVMKGDTLIFRCLGFSDALYAIPDSNTHNELSISIQLTKTSYELDGVDIIALSRKKQTKYDLIHMAPDDSGWENQMVMPGMMRGDYKFIKESERMGAQPFRPFKAIAYAMGKDVRDLTRLQIAEEQGEKDDAVAKKYSRTKVKEFTKYHYPKLDCFTLFLELDQQFLLDESEYAIFSKIRQEMISFEFQYREDSLAMLKRLLDYELND